MHLDAASPSSWASVLYSRGLIQKKSLARRDQNACIHLNGRVTSNDATDDILLPTFEVGMKRMMEETHMLEATLHDGSTIEIEVHGTGPTLLLPVNPQPVIGPQAELMRQYGTDPALGQSLIKGLSDAFRVVAFDYEGQCLRRPKPDTLTPANTAKGIRPGNLSPCTRRCKDSMTEPLKRRSPVLVSALWVRRMRSSTTSIGEMCL